MLSSPTDDSKSTGTRIRSVRRGRRLTQRQLARTTGLAEPFLSRIENGRAVPSLRTIERLAEGLGVSVGDLLAAPAGMFRPACPVSGSGRCIAEQIYVPGQRVRWATERYSPKQIELLRLGNYLVQFGSRETLAALDIVMHGMLRLRSTKRNTKWLRSLKRAESEAD